ncbi:MAG: aminotransferase class V-fold PLP-dependent enzyme [Candidatus Moranbacteria bacterium]|nr:aminotransferase class V-fold PLP-dependent enzyme [Candidatus Moranbacteria bacterium]
MTAKKKLIYLDNSATTPVNKEVLKKVLPYFDQKYGNASSIHNLGQEAAQAVQKAKKKIAKTLRCKDEEVIFTSGATESNNLAIKGLFLKLAGLNKYKNKKLHFISSTIEHHCVLDTLKALQQNFADKIEISYIDVDSKGLIKIDELKKAVKQNTVLVSVMFVNNEIGTVQPIEEIGAYLNKIKKKRNPKVDLPLYFHSDAVQAINYFDCNFPKNKLDLLSLSGHKIYAPKGVGALIIKKGTLIEAIIDGGGQERNLRSGTYNVSGIVGIGEAVSLAGKGKKERVAKTIKLRDYLLKKISREIPKIKINGDLKKRSPNNLNISFKGIEGESIVLLLSNYNICVSTGSACSSNSLDPSHVQLAIGNDHLTAHGSIRFSLGENITKKDLDYTVEKLKLVVEKLRKTSKGINF